MVRHIVIWQLKDELTSEQKAAAKAKIKEMLEALLGKVDGMTSCRVLTEALGSSNADVMLISEHESVEALAAYQVHPLHMLVKEYVGSVRKERICFDYKD